MTFDLRTRADDAEALRAALRPFIAGLALSSRGFAALRGMTERPSPGHHGAELRLPVVAREKLRC
jgi:hypothetical protein